MSALSTIKTLVKHEMSKWGCLLGIALVIAVVTLAVRGVLGLLDFEQADRERIGERVGMYAGGGVFALVMVAGLVQVVREWKAKGRASSAARHLPPPLPQGRAAVPPPLPEKREGDPRYAHGHRRKSGREKW